MPHLLRSLLAAPFARRRRAGPRRRAFHYEHVLGTSLELQVVAVDATVARRADAAVLAEIDRLAAILSGWTDDSELSRWQATHGVPVPVSPELAEVLALAEAWRVGTWGAFDAAAVSLVAPLSESLPESRQPLWTVDGARGTATRLTRRATSLDAIGKGYIVERAAACAHAVDGVTQVLLNVGGDLRHHGDRPLTVAITDPRAPAENAPPIARVRIRDEALATSGGYRRGRAVDGRTLSHIVDPRTGRSAERVRSASVVAPDCATADALATAFSVLAPSESVALADEIPGVGCLLVEADGTITASDGWRARRADDATA
jgi:thiamine biosynthesis lipoprotein